MIKPARQLRELLAAPGIIRSLGAHDVFTALIVEQAGFETVFIGGFGTSASLLGLPDLNFLTMTEMAEAVRRMATRVTIPVIADGDTGHGDLHNVQRTVAMFEAAGSAGILLEDQLMPKRCGHIAGKALVPADEYVAKLRMMRAVADDLGHEDFVIISRTDGVSATEAPERRLTWGRSRSIARRTGRNSQKSETPALREHALRRRDAYPAGA